MYAHNVVGPRCQENIRRKHFIFPYADMVGPYCHPLHVQASADSSCLLTILTMREGGTAASTAKCVEDDGEASDIRVHYLGDGGAVMPVLRRSQPWEAEAGGPASAGLVLAAGGRQDCKSSRST